jgi:hypothetical protein
MDVVATNTEEWKYPDNNAILKWLFENPEIYHKRTPEEWNKYLGTFDGYWEITNLMLETAF